MVVTADMLNVRKAASVDADVLDHLARGTEVEASELSSDKAWLKVKRGTVEGWASFKFLQPVIDGVQVSPFRWFDIATAELGKGVSEKKGAAANPRIVDYLQSTGLSATMATSDETAWCSAFVNFCVEQAGFEGTNSASARSWLKWGVETDKPVPGCICVFERGAPPSGHVAFFVSESGDDVEVLGGNQGNAVSIRKYPKKKPGSRLLSYRVPKSG